MGGFFRFRELQVARAVEPVAEHRMSGDQLVQSGGKRFGQIGQRLLFWIPVNIHQLHRAVRGFEGVELVIVEDGRPAGGFIIGLIRHHMPERSIDHKEHLDKFMRMKVVPALEERWKIFNGQTCGLQMLIRLPSDGFLNYR